MYFVLVVHVHLFACLLWEISIDSNKKVMTSWFCFICRHIMELSVTFPWQGWELIEQTESRISRTNVLRSFQEHATCTFKDIADIAYKSQTITESRNFHGFTDILGYRLIRTYMYYGTLTDMQHLRLRILQALQTYHRPARNFHEYFRLEIHMDILRNFDGHKL